MPIIRSEKTKIMLTVNFSWVSHFSYTSGQKLAYNSSVVEVFLNGIRIDSNVTLMCGKKRLILFYSIIVYRTNTDQIFIEIIETASIRKTN